jgi:hypothetical protein
MIVLCINGHCLLSQTSIRYSDLYNMFWYLYDHYKRQLYKTTKTVKEYNLVTFIIFLSNLCNKSDLSCNRIKMKILKETCIFIYVCIHTHTHDSSVGVAVGYGLYSQGSIPG